MTWYPYFISTFVALGNNVPMSEVEFAKRMNIFFGAVYSYGIEQLRSSEKKLRAALELLFKDVHPMQIESNFAIGGNLTIRDFRHGCRMNPDAPPKNWVLVGTFVDEKKYDAPMCVSPYGGFKEVHPSQAEFSAFIRACMSKQIFFTEYNDETPYDRELVNAVRKIAPKSHERTRAGHLKRLKEVYADLGKDAGFLLYDALFQSRKLNESEYMKYPQLTNLLTHYSLTYYTPESIDHICKLYPEHKEMFQQRCVTDEEFEKICNEFPTKAVELYFIREHSFPEYDFSDVVCSDAKYRPLDCEFYKPYLGKDAKKVLDATWQ